MPDKSTASADATKSELDSLRSDLARLKDDLRALGDNMVGRATVGARQAKDRAQERWEESVGSVENYVKDHPLSTVLIAFGAGLIVSRIFKD